MNVRLSTIGILLWAILGIGLIGRAVADEPWGRMAAAVTADRHRCSGPARFHNPACKDWEVPVAATFFRGQTTDFSVAGNWTNSVPDSTHTPAIFDGSVTQTSALTGLDRTGDMFTLVTYPNYGGKIGEPGNPLLWEAAYGIMRTATILGSGECHLENPLGDFAGIVIRPSRHVDIHLKGKYARLAVGSGNVLLDAYSNFGAGDAGFLWIVGSGTKVLLPAAPGAEIGPTQCRIDGGYFTSRRGFADVVDHDEFIISGGEWIQETKLVRSGHITMLGGVMRYKPDPGALDEPVHFTGIRGTLDLSSIGESLLWGSAFYGPEFDVIENVQGTLSPDIDFRNKWP